MIRNTSCQQPPPPPTLQTAESNQISLKRGFLHPFLTGFRHVLLWGLLLLSLEWHHNSRFDACKDLTSGKLLLCRNYEWNGHSFFHDSFNLFCSITWDVKIFHLAFLHLIFNCALIAWWNVNEYILYCICQFCFCFFNVTNDSQSPLFFLCTCHLRLCFRFNV